MKKYSDPVDPTSHLVSVIVPVYNSEKYLRRCIESIINQSYKNIEIILINDGSTDNSGEICNANALSDNRIRVIHTRNNGPAAARNIGIKSSKGSFLFFVDSDDLIESHAINLLIENYCRTKADIVMGDYKIENYNANPIEKEFLLSSDKLLEKKDIINYVRNYLKKPTGHSLFIYNWGKLFKSSIVRENKIYFDTGLQVFEDISFNFEYLKFVSSAYYVKNRLYTYMISDGLASAGMKIYDNPVGYKLALKSIGEFLKGNGIGVDTIEKEVGNACISFTIRTMVRFFALTNVNLKYVYKLISNMISDPDIRQNLKLYSPTKGDSRILPILMKLKLVWLIIWVCKYKAHKRYGKGAAAK